ncbi:MAG TPA: hypothetical protein VFM18_22410 [Methanosarcina sp.]|nr:hypothetical protein [Methanosarcina sp.]
MKFEIEINGKNYSFTKLLRIIMVLVFFGAMVFDVYKKDWNALAIDSLFLVAVIQGNEITDLQDEVEKLSNKDDE